MRRSTLVLRAVLALVLLLLVAAPLAPAAGGSSAEQWRNRLFSRRDIGLPDASLQDTDKDKATLANNDDTKVEEDDDELKVRPTCGLALYRLPQRIKPTNYNLVVRPDLEALRFEGSVEISVRVGGSPQRNSKRQGGTNGQVQAKLAANKIVLHAGAELKVGDVWFRDLGPIRRSSLKSASSPKSANSSDSVEQVLDYVEVTNVCRDEHYQLIVVTLARELSDRSRGILHLSFSGLLSNNMRGFYKSAYKKSEPNDTLIDSSSAQTKHYHAITQLQAVEARRLFPCFDEPAFKATFDVTLTYPNNRLALSNMEPIYRSLINGQENTDNGTSLVRFARTPPMSSYLLALFVGQLDYVEGQLNLSSGGGQLEQPIQLRVYTPLGLQRLGRFALEMVQRAIPILQDYFKLDFPLKKLDLVPVGDFEAGAMENWGLITFKDSSLLVDDLETSVNQKIYVACTIVHELAHQWFGNLVTMKWWNELWLNEGMASWLESQLMEELFPDYEMSSYFLIKSHIYGLNMDSFRWAHPIELDQEQVEAGQDIDTLFDAISYNKASSIVRQLSKPHLFSSDWNNFRASIQYYINAHKYANTNLNDLMEALEKLRAPDQLADFLRSWISEPGHPLISVSMINNHSNNELLLKQERFICNLAELDEDEAQQRWLVPVTLFARGFDENDNEQRALIRTSMNLSSVLAIRLPAWFNHKTEGNWVKVNVNFTGFYRVSYSDELDGALRRAVLLDELPAAADRINLLDDAHSLVQANRMPAHKLLKLMESYSHETNGAVLDHLTRIFKSLLKLYRPSAQLHAKLAAFGSRLLGECIYQRVHLFKPMRSRQPLDSTASARESLYEQSGRETVLEVLGAELNYKPVTRYLLELFDNRTSDALSPERPPVNLRAAVYKTVAARGSQEQVSRLLLLYNRTLDWQREERQRIAIALTGGAGQLRERAELVWSWMRAHPELEDRLELLGGLANGAGGRRLIGRLLEKNLSELVAMGDEAQVTALAEELSVSLDDAEVAWRELLSLFERHKSSESWKESRDFVRQTLDWRSAVRSNELDKLERRLEQPDLC